MLFPAVRLISFRKDTTHCNIFLRKTVTLSLTYILRPVLKLSFTLYQ